MFDALGVRLGLLSAMVMLSSSAWGQPEEPTLVPITFINTAPIPMTDVRIGSATVSRIEPGASVTVEAESQSEAQGRFELSSWGETYGEQ